MYLFDYQAAQIQGARPRQEDSWGAKGVTTYRISQRPEKEDAPRQTVDSLVNAAMAASVTYCGDCGAPGRLRPRRWRRTLCDVHAKPGWTPRQERPT